MNYLIFLLLSTTSPQEIVLNVFILLLEFLVLGSVFSGLHFSEKWSGLFGKNNLKKSKNGRPRYFNQSNI